MPDSVPSSEDKLVNKTRGFLTHGTYNLMGDTDITLKAQSSAFIWFHCLQRVLRGSITWIANVDWEVREVLSKDQHLS